MTDETTPPPADRPGAAPLRGIAPISIEDEVKKSYLDYAMSVIVSRALPDLRDGLKPVQRRILYSMNEQGHTPDRGYVKSARVVGDVMGKYHPHGDLSIYDTLVRMAQPFSMSLLLIDGQGNFGSVDNDPPAAMRYTECRLTNAADVDHGRSRQGHRRLQGQLRRQRAGTGGPSVEDPNLLVNGAGGIAVGMATNIPPHNLGEIVDACLALIDRPDLPMGDCWTSCPAPTFPPAARSSAAAAPARP